MKHIQLLLVTLLFCACSGSSKDAVESPNKGESKAAVPSIEKIYELAITDFIKMAPSEYKLPLDTILFGKLAYGASTDFPNINLPPKILNSRIFLVTPEEGEERQKRNPKNVYINLIGTVEPSAAIFEFIVFYNGFAHQYDHHFEYKIEEGRLVLLGHRTTDYRNRH